MLISNATAYFINSAIETVTGWFNAPKITLCVKTLIAFGTSIAGQFFNTQNYQGVAAVCDGVSNALTSNLIYEGLDVGADVLSGQVNAVLERFDYQTPELIAGITKLGLGSLARLSAGHAATLKMPWCFQDVKHEVPVGQAMMPNPIIEDEPGFFSKVMWPINWCVKGILSFGQTNEGLENNNVSNGLDTAGKFLMFSGIQQVAKGLWDLFKGNNKVCGLRELDIRQILIQLHQEDTKEAIVKLSNEMFQQFQATKSFLEQPSNAPLLTHISIVSAMYERYFEKQYADLSGPNIGIFCKLQAESEVVQKIMDGRNAKKQYHALAQSLPLSPIPEELLKQMTYFGLRTELNKITTEQGIVATADEKKAFNELLHNSTYHITNLNMTVITLIQHQGDAKNDTELNHGSEDISWTDSLKTYLGGGLSDMGLAF